MKKFNTMRWLALAVWVAATMCLAQGTLREGDRGDDVSALQSRLVELGFLTQAQADTGTGVFGPATKAAIVEFQKSRGLSPDGVVGPATQASLQGNPTPSNDVAPGGSLNAGMAPSADGSATIFGNEQNPKCGSSRCAPQTEPCTYEGNTYPPLQGCNAETSRDLSCAYYDQKCILTIGIGHANGVKANYLWSQDQVIAAYVADTRAAANTIIETITQRKLTQEQFDALVDFCFNAGCKGRWSQRALKVINDDSGAPINEDLLFKEMYENPEKTPGNKVRYMAAWSIVTGKPASGDLKTPGTICYGRLDGVVQQGTCLLEGQSDTQGKRAVSGSCPAGKRELVCYM